MPLSTAVNVDCVSALSVRSTIGPSPVISVHDDQRFAPVTAAPTLPCGEPERLAKRNWPSQPPPRFGPQSIAASVYVSTTCKVRRTSTGAAPGTSVLAGKPPLVIACVRRRPRASVVASRR